MTIKSIFNKGRVAQLEALVAEFEIKGVDISNALAAVNEKIADLNAAIGAYNEKLGEARELQEEVAGGLADYIDNRSDKWRESPAGDAWTALKERWDGVDLEDVEEIEPLEELDLAHRDDLENLPTELDPAE